MNRTIANNYDPAERRLILQVEKAYLYRPESEWTYSHHPSLTHFRERFYTIWSNGRVDEDAPGQRVLLSTSSNFVDWSDPVPLVDSMPGQNSELVLTAAGFHQYGGGLVAYVGQYECAASSLALGGRTGNDCEHERTTLGALTTGDGSAWDPLVDLGLPIVPNHPPQATRSGRLIISGNISFPYSDEPDGLSGWRMSGIYPADMVDVYDDSKGFWKVKERAGWPVGLCEGSFYQTDDGVLHMPLRSGTPWLWASESSDDGRTWSRPQPTRFSDNVTKFHFGRLADGRFYYVGCPDPEPRGGRSPLVLSLSRDGLSFDRHYILAADEPYEQKRAGLHKGGLYGYPHTMVHDGMLCVIVSLRKEAVAVMRVPLSAI